MNVNYLIIFAIWLLASIGCSANIVDDLVRVYYEMTEAAFAPHHAVIVPKSNNRRPKANKPEGVGKTRNDDILTVTICETETPVAPTIGTLSLPTVVTAPTLIPTVVVTGFAPTMTSVGTEVPSERTTELSGGGSTEIPTGQSHVTSDTTFVSVTKSVATGHSSVMTGIQTVPETTVPHPTSSGTHSAPSDGNDSITSSVGSGEQHGNHTVSTDTTASTGTRTHAHPSFPTTNEANDYEGMASSAFALAVALAFSLVRI
ncbi:hypothetical protein AtubIFM55763_001274 [Aspergillus tubingensis]|uniref:Uncharacterized protein n=2 Tax=Aspergillus subgen. Circumdati TaxID=2720871 RepID=A0A8H3ST98_ASPTU|nr:Stm1 family protein [Aspergillus tubingensis]GAQ36400.1 similar to An02g06950 [Aspergillus niger]GFN14503.1 Stm1 family protein [Aspergillus tubingensis]GLA57317.1 hypothetical protein AtubIFM54640_003449 [Aspergillus tubingensis]GLA70994.1 hypothetical protein AtubIFM55763_001274 [Aspergillus tubingensis]GLA87923.1 hypothetical protein AtubIFM56815_002356 [Aspergillus tubingensis]